MKAIQPEGAAYKVVPGCTAEQAAEKGYAVVELSMATNPPTPIYGFYTDTETGAALERTVPADSTTKVVPAGSGAGAVFDANATGDKGALVNQNDPIIHGTDGQDIHADGSPAVDRHEQQEKLADVLAASNEAKAKAK